MTNDSEHKGMVRLYELQEGEWFYNQEGLILEMVTCDYDPVNPDIIEYAAKILKSDSYEHIRIQGHGVGEQYYYRYTGRDRSSFIAGFKMAMSLMLPYMGKFDLENTELENPIQQHLTMLKQYDKWKKNEGNLW